MTHSAPMADSDGEFGEYKEAPTAACRECREHAVWYCGGYEDYHYRCRACGHSWWVDGIDS